MSSRVPSCSLPTEPETDDPRPQFKPWFRCEIIPSEGVILLSERGHVLLRGNAYIQLAPLLDGQSTVEEIIGRLRGAVSAAEVVFALMRLQSQGYLVDATPSLPPERAAFWDALSVSSAEAEKRLREAVVSVVSFGALDPAPFQALLSSQGVQIGNSGQYWVVLTDDYLHEELDAFNQEAVAHDRPWLLVKPVGTELWLGPLFLPGKTGCWACLAQRLRGARKVQSYLQEKKNSLTPFSLPLTALPSTLQTAYSLAATETAKWIVCGRNEAIEGAVVTLNTVSLAKHSHRLVRRPQCSSCGDPTAVAARQSGPVVLQSCNKMFTTDGGHRTVTPEAAVKKLEEHVSPITGIVSVLLPNSVSVGDTTLPSYISGHNFIHVSPEDSLGWNFLYASLRGASAGKGRHDAQAKASALGEAIERYSGVFQGDEARLRARCTDLGAAAIHPNACMLFSEQQFGNRAAWNALTSPCTWVPEPFDVDQEIEWSPVWSLTYKEPRYVPTAYCYYDYAWKYQAWFARADSNGCAAGHSKEEAILQGFMELAERDAVALWWYNQLKKPVVNLSSFAESYFQDLHTYYQTLHRDVWVLDITSDLNIPTFAAVSRRNDKEVEDIIFGFGAHFDPRLAILRALTEVNQALPVVFAGTPDPQAEYSPVDRQLISWWQSATIDNQPYLAPDAALVPKVQADYPRCWSDDLYTDVTTCVQIAADRGLETLVLDQTRPDIGLQVVKVFVPGLRHFWPRFAPGRLYDVPAQMGWVTRPVTEDDLNPQYIYV